MLRFLHTADIHLDSPLLKLEHYEGAPVEALRNAGRRAFENLVSLAICEQTDFVLIAGDLYDGDWKDYNTGLYFVSQMAKLREADIRVFIIAGNHDAASRMTKSLRLPDNVSMLSDDRPKSFQLDNLGIAVHGQSFPTRTVKKDLSSDYPFAVPGYFNIGMLHTCATGREGHESYSPCTVEGLCSKNYDYWALGHVHRREILCEEPMIVFPGNIQGRHIRESGPKGCMAVTVNDRGQVETEFRPLDVIRWINSEIDAADAADEDDVIGNICNSLDDIMEKNEGVPLAVRLDINLGSRVRTAIASAPEQWIAAVRSAAIDSSGGSLWIEKVKLRAKTEPAGIPEGPVGEILQFFDEVRSDPDRLKSLGESLNDLWKKLPREMKEGPGAISPENTVWLAEMLDQARNILLSKVRGSG